MIPMDDGGLKNNLLRNNTKIPPPVFKSKSGFFKWMIIVIVGMIVMFVGGMWVIIANWTPPPISSNYDNYHDYQKDLSAWKNLTRTGNLYGRVIMGLGTSIITLSGFLGAIDTSMDDREKVIMIIIGIAAMSLFLLLSVGLVMVSPYSQ